MWKCNQSRPGFELVSPCPFPTTITTTPRAPPRRLMYSNYLYLIDIHVLILSQETNVGKGKLWQIKCRLSVAKCGFVVSLQFPSHSLHSWSSLVKHGRPVAFPRSLQVWPLASYSMFASSLTVFSNHRICIHQQHRFFSWIRVCTAFLTFFHLSQHIWFPSLNFLLDVDGYINYFIP